MKRVHNSDLRVSRYTMACAPGIKRGGQLGLDKRGCNHTQSLARTSQQAELDELNDAFAHAARRLEMASRPTERLTLPAGQPLSESLYSFDPPHNDLAHLVTRLRQLAIELFKAQDVQLQLTAPPDLERVKFTTEQCQQLFLLFKEALHNIAAHAQCSTVSLAVSIGERKLEIKLRDNGSSFIGKLLGRSAIGQRGGGLREMQTRAAKLGGALEIASAPGWGTSLTLTLRRQC